MEFLNDAVGHAHAVAKQYALSSHVCPCDVRHTCEIVHQRPVRMSHDWVLLQGEIRQDERYAQGGFHGRGFAPKRCAP